MPQQTATATAELPVALTPHCHVASNGLSKCCNAHPYRLNSGPWHCGTCSRHCETYVPQRTDSLADQLATVARLAEQAGCLDAAQAIRERLLDQS